ncbi:MAG: AraC family ligand binding domain-containing protein, partial [Coprobacillus sp.]
MKITYDNDYEKVESTLRDFDKNKYCLFVDQADINGTQSIIDSHWHEWLEITHVIDGEMTLMVPEKTYHIHAGEIVVIGMQTLHRITGNLGNYRFQCLHVNVGFILQYLNPILLNEKVIVIKEKERFLNKFMDVIALLKREDIISELRYKAALLEMLSLCLEEVSFNKDIGQSETNDVFSHILFYVSTHYQENISLQE